MFVKMPSKLVAKKNKYGGGDGGWRRPFLKWSFGVVIIVNIYRVQFSR